MSIIFTLAFWKATAERSIKTFAQAALGFLVTAGIGVLDVNWANVLSVAALSAIASILSSIVSTGVGTPGPSLAGEYTIPSAIG